MMQDGKTFEKAGVNISVVTGNLPPQAVQQMKSRYVQTQGSYIVQNALKKTMYVSWVVSRTH